MYSTGKVFQIFAIVLLVATMGLFGFTTDANAQTTLTAGDDVSLASSLNWTPVQIPVAGDSLVLGANTLTYDAGTTVGAISMAGGTINIANGNATITRGITAISGVNTINNGTAGGNTTTSDINVLAGTLALTPSVASSWTGNLTLAGGTALTNNSFATTITGNVTVGGDVTITDGGTSTISWTGTFSNSAASTVTFAAGIANGVRFGSTISLGADLTFVQTVAPNFAFVITINTTVGASGDVTLVNGADIGGSHTKLDTLGGGGGTLVLDGDGVTGTLYTLQNHTSIAGNVTLADNDYLVSGVYEITINAGATFDHNTTGATSITDKVNIAGTLKVTQNIQALNGVVTTTGDGAVIDIDVNQTFNSAGNGLVTNSNTTINIAPGITLTVSNGENVVATEKTLIMSGGGTIAGGGAAQTLNAGSVLRVGGSLGVQGIGAVILGGGEVDIDTTTSFSASMDATAGGIIDIASGFTLDPGGNLVVNDDNTLEFQGAGGFLAARNVTVGSGGAATLTLTGAMTTATFDSVISNTVTTINVNARNTFQTLTVSAGATIDFTGASLTLNIVDPVTANRPVAITGISTGVISGGDWTLTNSITNTNIASPNISSNLIGINGGSIVATKALNITGNMVMGAGDLAITATENVTYSGDAIDMGDQNLTIDGTRTFDNSNDLQLNGSGDLIFTGAATVSKVAVTGTAEIIANIAGGGTATVTTLTQTGAIVTLKYSVASNQIALAGGLTVPAGQSLVIANGAATETLVLSGGTLDFSAAGARFVNFELGGMRIENNFMVGNGENTINSLTFAALDTLDGNITTSITGIKGGSVLKFPGTSHIRGSTITLRGGAALEIYGPVTADTSSAIVINSDSTVILRGRDTFTYNGAPITVAADSFRVQETVNFSNNASNPISVSTTILQFEGAATVSDLALTDAAAKIVVNGGNPTIDTLTTTSAGLNLEFGAVNAITVGSDITLGDGAILNILTGSGGTLTGAGVINVTGEGAEIENNATGATISQNITFGNATTAAVIDVNSSLSLSGALTLAGKGTIDIATGQTQVYNGTAITVEAGEILTFQGGGTFDNLNPIVLGTTTSSLFFGTDGITLNAVALNDHDIPLTLNGATAVITTLTTNSKRLNFVFSNTTDSLGIPGNIAMSAEGRDTLTVSGKGGQLGTDITTPGVNSRVVFNSAGFVLDGNLTIGNAGAGAEDSLVVSADATIKGNLIIEDDASITNSATLSYTGGDVSLGDFTLFLDGDGTFDNNALGGGGAVLINNTGTLQFNGGATIDSVVHSAAGFIAVNGGDATFNHVVTAGANLTLQYEEDNVITLNDATAAAGFSLIIANSAIDDTDDDNEGTLAGSIDLTGAGATLDNQMTSSSGTETFTISAAIDIGNDTTTPEYKSAGDVTQSGAITVSGNADFNVATAGKVVDYTGAEISVGIDSVNIIGVGRITNTNPVTLDSVGSILNYAAAGSLGTAKIGDLDGTNIVAVTGGYLGSLQNASANITITPGTGTLVIDGETTIADVDTLFISGAGTGSVAGAGSEALKAVTVVYDNTGGATVAKTLEIGNAVTAGVLDVQQNLTADSILFGGDATITGPNGSNNLTVNELLGNTAAATVTSDTNGTVTVAGGAIRVGGDLTFANATDNVYAFGSADSVTSTSATLVTVTFPDSVIFSSAVFSAGTAGNWVALSPAPADTFITITGATPKILGGVSNAGDDTLRVSNSIEIGKDGILKSASDDSYIELGFTGTMNINGTINANAGTIEILASAGLASATEIDLDKTGKYVADGTGTLILPSGFTSDLDNSDDSVNGETAGITVDGSGLLISTVVDSFHVFDNQDDDRANISLVGGTVKWIEFTISVTGTSTNVNNTRYVTAVFVSIWAESAGDGTPETPYQTIAEGIANASGGEVRIAAGTYQLSATVVLDSVQLIGTANQLDFGEGVNNSWADGAGVGDVAPVLVYSNTTGAAFEIKAHNAVVQGLKVVTAEGNSDPVILVDDGNVLTNLEIANNSFVVQSGQVVVMFGDSTAVRGADINFNSTTSEAGGGYNFLFVDQPDSSIDDIDVQNNDITNASPAIHLHVGGGNVGDVDVSNNNFIASDGVHIGRIGDAVSTDGLFGSISVTDNNFTSSDYAFRIANGVAADYDGNIHDNLTVNDNHFFFADGATDNKAVINGITDETVTADDFIDATSNWWGSFNGPGQAGGADASDRVDTSPWDMTPNVGPNTIVVTGVAEAFTLAPIEVTVFVGTGITEVEFETNFAANVPNKQSVTANSPNAVDEQTYKIIPKETKEGAIIRVKSGANSGSTNIFDITEIVIAGVGNTLAASDWPGDSGELIRLEWTASTNHAGNGSPDVQINYYQIYAGATDDIGAATWWAVLPASGILSGAGTTIRAKVDAFSTSASSFYWVAAVRSSDDDSAVISGYGSSATATKASVASAMLVDASDAIFSDRIVSLVSNANRAFALDNSRDVGDFVGNRAIELDDFQIFAAFFGNDEEVEPAFDLNNDGKVGILDLSRFAKLFAQDNPGGGAVAAKGILGNQISDLINFDSVYDSKTEQMEFTISMSDVEALGGYGFDVVYDSKTFELVEIVNGKFLEENGGSQFSFDYKADGVVTIANVLKELNENTAVSGDGIAATLKFKWLGVGENNSIQITGIQILDAFGAMSYLENLDIVNLIPVPLVFELKNNYPNPFNPTTTIEYALPSTELVKIDIVNVLGQVVTTLVNEEVDAGFHQVIWNGRNTLGAPVASGIYIYRIKAGTFTSVKRLTLLK